MRDRTLKLSMSKYIVKIWLEAKFQPFGMEDDRDIYSNWKPKLLFCTPSCSLNISVIYQPNWLKFGLQAHFLKMFGHTKFQLSISCTFKAIELLLEIT